MTGVAVPLPSHRWSWRRGLWPAYVQYLKRSAAPILCGPWRTEIGFEVLYWIPFIHHLMASGIPPERIIPITRGGAGAWYGCPQGVELYAMRTPQDVRIENRIQHDRYGLQKQTRITAWDRAVVRDVAETMKLTRYHTLHPAWMFHGLAPYWTGRCGQHWLGRRTGFSRLPVPALPDTLRLPETFLAAKFYARETWPRDHKLAESLTAATLRKVADMSPIVVLTGDVHADEHLDFPIPVHPNIVRLKDLIALRPETNLAIQSAVLGRATGFIGTYGGFAQLALRMGIPSVSFYTEWGGTAITHKHLSDLLATAEHVPCQVFRASEIAITNFVLPIAEQRPVGPKLDTRAKVLQTA